MKYIIVLLISFLLLSCQSEQERQKSIKDRQSTELDSTSTDYYKKFVIYTLDSCQYVVVGYGDYRWGSHKGDCTNPIHQTK
jgi:thioredoxin-related protein